MDNEKNVKTFVLNADNTTLPEIEFRQKEVTPEIREKIVKRAREHPLAHVIDSTLKRDNINPDEVWSKYADVLLRLAKVVKDEADALPTCVSMTFMILVLSDMTAEMEDELREAMTKKILSDPEMLKKLTETAKTLMANIREQMQGDSQDDKASLPPVVTVQKSYSN